jgi:predicted anti-sigma-YlaC factor YlaD
MTPCAEYLPLLSDHAAGELAPADAARLAAHLAGCGGCRAEAEALAAVLSMASLPPPTELERSALTGLAESIRLEQRRAGLRLRAPLRYAAALLAVAAAAAFLVAPTLARRAPRPAAVEVAATTQAEAWEAPDADELWSASDLAFDDGAAAAMTSADELALDVVLAEE